MLHWMTSQIRWTKATRRRLHGFRHGHKADPKDQTYPVAEAWALLQTAPGRAPQGNGVHVGVAQSVRNELDVSDPPRSLEVVRELYRAELTTIRCDEVALATWEGWVACRALMAVGEASAGGANPDSDSGQGSGVSTTRAGTTTAPGASMGTSTGASSGSFPPGYLLPPDGGNGSEACDVWARNCPAGEKCMPWANDGGQAWNATKCTPIARDPDQADEPCNAVDSAVSGVDSCDDGLMCWGVDTDTLMGSCVPLCIGSESSPLCEDPSRLCILGSSGILNLCIASCDPLTQDCLPGQGCYRFNGGFICAPDTSGDNGAFGDPCPFGGISCDPGLGCADADLVAGCAESECCTPFCDIGSPTCPPDTQCQSLWEAGQAPPGNANIGRCTVAL